MKQNQRLLSHWIMPILLIGATPFFVSSWIANAQVGPSVSTGNIPYRSFTGYVQNTSSPVDLISNSSEAFVVTTLLSNRDGQYGSLNCELKIDNNSALNPNAAYATTSSAFEAGNAHLVVNPGSTLAVSGFSGACYYYVEVYYAHP